MDPIVIVCGATASGKSATALDIAQTYDGVIINADAMQVYRELRILTARPTEAQEAAVPHRLYGVMSAGEKCSAAKWLDMAKPVIDETLAKGKAAIVTGGTGLYIKALMQGLSPIPDIPEESRLQAIALWEELGARALQARDPHMAAKLKDGDTQRHIRALEVMLATGKSLAYWQEVPRILPHPDRKFDVKYIEVPRLELYQRCDARLLAMMEAGGLLEARQLYDMQLPEGLPATRAVGLQELFSHLKGECLLDEAVKRAQQATRNYAKRQMTWFRHQLLR